MLRMEEMISRLSQTGIWLTTKKNYTQQRFCVSGAGRINSQLHQFYSASVRERRLLIQLFDYLGSKINQRASVTGRQEF